MIGELCIPVLDFQVLASSAHGWQGLLVVHEEHLAYDARLELQLVDEAVHVPPIREEVVERRPCERGRAGVSSGFRGPGYRARLAPRSGDATDGTFGSLAADKKLTPWRTSASRETSTEPERRTSGASKRG